ncbi:hypothetical protein CRENBAI_010555 [Crenichthys baileyi]|uniref:Uncharacterized protein n=1 Tax=Crenichthys baileyi TaxID=28760 RepID=A0AAV9SKZ7_9TELE
MYGDEVEIVPSPMLLQEMEEAEGRQPTPVFPVSIPGRIRSSLSPTVSATSTSSRRRHHRHKPSSSPTGTAAAAEFPAGFGSCPGRRRRRGAAAIREVRMGASNPSSEGPSAMASSRLFSPELVDSHPAPSVVLQPSVQPPAHNWLQARLEKMKKDLKRQRCFTFGRHLMAHPEDLDLVHSVLQAEFITEGWLVAPAPVSTGGPFDPLLLAIRAAQILKDPGPLPGVAKLYEPLQPLLPEFPEGSEDGLPLLPEFPEGSEDGPPEFPEGSDDGPPQLQIPEFPEGSEDGPPLHPEFPEGSEDGPPLHPEFPEGSEDGPPLHPEFPEGFEDKPPLLPVPEGFENEAPLLPVSEGFKDEPPLILAPGRTHCGQMDSAPGLTDPQPDSEPQPAAAGSSEPQPAASGASEPQPAAAGSSEPQPAAAGSSEPQPAAAGSSEPQPAAAGSSEPQPAAAGSSEPQPAAAGSSEPRLILEGPMGGLPPLPRLIPEEFKCPPWFWPRRRPPRTSLRGFA